MEPRNARLLLGAGQGFFEDAKGGNAFVADKALRRIASFYEIEACLRVSRPKHRFAVRQAESAPIIGDIRCWLEGVQPKLPRDSDTAKAIGYTLNHWKGLIRFLDDGQIQLDTDLVEQPFFTSESTFFRMAA